MSKAKPRIPPMAAKPLRELRVTRIQVAVTADVLENGRKIDEVMLGPTDENGTRPYVFYDTDVIREWAERFPAELANLNKTANAGGRGAT
jgi:hypothetical protein